MRASVAYRGATALGSARWLAPWLLQLTDRASSAPTIRFMVIPTNWVSGPRSSGLHVDHEAVPGFLRDYLCPNVVDPAERDLRGLRLELVACAEVDHLLRFANPAGVGSADRAAVEHRRHLAEFACFVVAAPSAAT